jgi:hypothetical protein
MLTDFRITGEWLTTIERKGVHHDLILLALCGIIYVNAICFLMWEIVQLNDEGMDYFR